MLFYIYELVKLLILSKTLNILSTVNPLSTNYPSYARIGEKVQLCDKFIVFPNQWGVGGERGKEKKKEKKYIVQLYF